MPARLNVAALRQRQLPGARASSDSARSLTRRELLGAAGAAAAIVSPAARALGDSLQGPFELKRKDGAAIFEYAGEARWIIDPKDFGGRPELTIEQAEKLIKLSLTGATYPGTDLPAGFTCEIKQGLAGWKLKLKHALGGFSGQAPFESWLAGRATLESSVTVKAEVCRLGGEAPVRLDGEAHAEYRPDGGFCFRGDAFAQIDGEESLAGDRVELSLLGGSDPSVFEDPASARTVLTLHREGRHWSFKPIADDLPAGELTCYSDAFERLHVELAPGAVALLAEAGSGRSDISFRPHSKLQNSENAPFELKLRNARYAVAFEKEGPRTALIADYDEPSWMHGDGCSVMVGDGPNAVPFELVSRAGKTESMTVRPALLGFSAPLGDAVVEPGMLPEGETIEFVPEQQDDRAIRPQTLNTQAINQVKLNPIFAHIGIALATRIRVIRPEDMLALEFQPINLRFQGGGNNRPSLVRSNAGQAAYLVVHFPPQHIAESTGDETVDPSTKGPKFTPPPPLPSGPIATRMAGPSRLAFLVPSSVTAIPYTIEGLLDWAKLTPSVVPAADPPPALLQLTNGALAIQGVGLTKQAAAIEDDARIRLTRTISNRPATRALDTAGINPPRPNLGAISPQAIPEVPQERSLIQSAKLQPTKINVAKIPISIAALIQDKSIREPHHFETAIEFPYRVTLSPHDISGWKHESDLEKVRHGNRTELWHTRLGTLRRGQVDEYDDYYRTVRAVWSEDYNPTLPAPNPPNPLQLTLSAKHRNLIVWRSAEWTKLEQAGKKVVPQPIPAQQFMLTPLGACVDLHGKWDLAVVAPLMEWVNKSQLGRDNFVRTEMAGYLMPFGHRAVLVEVSERKISTFGQERFAVLYKKRWVEVKEPDKTFPVSGMLDSGNRMPFTRVHIKTKRTPNMDPPQNTDHFFPIVAQKEFPFSIAATDRAGKESEFSMPLMFVGTDQVHVMPNGTNKLSQMLQMYNGSTNGRLRIADMQGQQIGFAPVSVPGDTVLDTQNITWKAEALTTITDTRVTFAPAMATADVGVPAARAVADAAGNIKVEYPQIYWENGFGGVNSKNQVYLKLMLGGGAAPQLNYTASGKGEKAGGMAAPNVAITSISRKYGVIGGKVDGQGSSTRGVGAPRGAAPAWDFNPKEYFGDQAKLLGFLALKEILPDTAGGDGKNVPKLTFKEEPDKLTTILDWNPDIWVPNPINKLFVPTKQELSIGGDKWKDMLNIKCELVTWLPFGDAKPSEPTYDILGQVNHFKLDLFGCIELLFDYVKFTAKSGAGVDVDPKFGKPEWIVFKGPLAFVNKLKDMLGGGSDSRGMTRFGGTVGDIFQYYIDPSPSGIRAGFTVNVPSVAVGVFSLQNIGVGADLDIPFTGDPVTMTFNFCSRDNQFLLTVWIFGGGGYFNLTVGLAGIMAFEAGFQFGVAASISFGIASGGVSVMAGFSYDYEAKEKGKNLAGSPIYEGYSTLTGYFEANGWVDVLGLISASLELYLGLEYTSGGGKSELWGTARITFRIEILFLSFEVSAEVEKRFAGSGPSSRAIPAAANRAAVTSAMGGVKFEEIYSEPEWNEYCLAFA